MTIQDENAVVSIARLAATLGATLPEPITSELEHLAEIRASAQPRPQPGLIAKEVSKHLGDRAAFTEAKKAAALEVATAEANAKLDGHLASACAHRLRAHMRTNADTVAAAIGAGLADDLATLATEAPKLPAYFRAEHADSLDPATFTAWTRCRDAHTRISASHGPLLVLYSGAVKDTSAFGIVALTSLRFAKPPTFTTAKAAYDFRDALAGRTARVQGLAGQGTPYIDDLFIPAVLAHVGATFEWATPSEVHDRAEQIVAGMVTKTTKTAAAPPSGYDVVIMR